MNNLLNILKQTNLKYDFDVIERAYELAKDAHEGQLRRSGDPYITHPLAVSLILAELGMDTETIAAALLHDVVEDTDIDLDYVKKQFGSEIALLVDGVTKLGKIPFSSREEQQAENIRKMLIAMAQDVRVIILKLADRLHDMRTLDYKLEQKRRDTALETMEVYAPIAQRLGIRQIQEELEDCSLRYLDPVAYNELETLLVLEKDERYSFLDTIKNKISERLTSKYENIYIEGRVKSVYGIYRKVYVQARAFDEIYDIYAVRIIVNTVNECYNILGEIHDMFRPLPNRFKDYISTPKPNMYQSLHTTVVDKEVVPFEVQIRTWDMHHTAEFGIAAGWKYKEGIEGKDSLEEKIAWVRQLLESQKDTMDAQEILGSIKSDFSTDEVFVFTPKGDVIALPVGSTVIDFAYAIHSEVGNRMIGAKIDGRMVSLDTKVITGMIINVITTNAPSHGPSRDWINIVRTASTRNKIRSWFKRERREENIIQGKAVFERELKSLNLQLESEIAQELVAKISEQQHYNDVEDFYASVGYGGILLRRIMPHIEQEFLKIVKKSNCLVTRLYQRLETANYKDAFYVLLELKETDNNRYEIFKDDLSFVFDPNKPLSDNESNWNRFGEAVKCKTILWILLTKGIKSYQNESILNINENIANEIDEANNSVLPKQIKRKDTPQKVGKNLEIGVLSILRNLFDIEDEENERILVELRRQLSGSQLGFDIRVAYNDGSGVCNCAIECKDYNTNRIELKEVTGKLEQLRMTGQTIHHWILISPNGKVDNYLDVALHKWEYENRYDPIQKIQIWTIDNDIDELFGLVPEIFDQYYTNNRRIEPAKWDKEKRKNIVKKWKDKLAPAIPLSPEWKDYLRNPSNLLTPSEQDPKIINDYNELYMRRVPIRCLDEAGNLLNGSAEQFIIDWIKRTDNAASVLFLLGEFGDGKTFLTYSIARRLTEDYVKTPNTGIIPIRLTLRDLRENVKTQEFLRIRLEAFGAHLKGFLNIKTNNKVVIILDGFDEMSTNMDSRTIELNTLRLRDCINDSFPGLKLIITSRTPIFKKFKHLLPNRIKVSEIIRLSPINRQDKITFLSSYANESKLDVRNRFDKLRHTHDLLGLASKALYLDMMKVTMLEEECIEELDDAVAIYDLYVKATLDRKKEHLEIDGQAVDIGAVFDKLTRLMEDVALIIFKSCKNGISINDLKQYQKDPLATRIWNELTYPTPVNNEDAENRIINRSLLKATDHDDSYTFCHRSMQEYFAAKGICRLLSESLGEAEDFLSKIDLTFETTDFAAFILKKYSNAKKIKSNIISLIMKTCGQPQANLNIARLGAVAISLYYKTWNVLPEIDFSNLVLDNSYLPEADFSGKNLTNTSLRNANLDNTNFNNANLSGCDLTGVRFEETKNIYSMVVFNGNQDDSFQLYVLYSDGRLFKWNMYNYKYEELVVSSANTNYIYATLFGLTLLQDSHLYFTKNTEQGLEFNGGVHLKESITIYDINKDKVLYSNNNQLYLYNFKEKQYIIEKYQISAQTKSIIVDDISIIIFNDDMGLRIVKKNEGKLSVKNFTAKEQNLKEITTISIIPDDKNNGLLRMCIGDKYGNLIIYDYYSLLDNEIDNNDCCLNKVDAYCCKQYLKKICFINFLKLAYTGTDGIIHVLKIDGYNKLNEVTQLKLAVQCKGAIIDGVKQLEQYNKLKSYRDADNEVDIKKFCHV